MKRPIITILLFFIIVAFVSGCNDSTRYIVRRLYNSRIDYTSGNSLILKDSIKTEFSVEQPVKLLTYMDSTVCGKCLENYLNAVSVYMNRIHSDSVMYVCVLQPRSINDIQIRIKELDLNHISIVYDRHDSFLKKNKIDKIPSEMTSFLLNKDDRVVLVGNPLKNKKIFDLFNSRIKEFSKNGWKTD